jgi:hypothetical protein
LDTESDWDMFRTQIMKHVASSMPAVKEEPIDSAVKEEPVDDNSIAEVHIEDVLNLQASISQYFRDGQPLGDLISSLRNGFVDPLQTPWLTLNVIKAKRFSKTVYFTYDHRRLFCSREAACRRIKVCVRLQGRYADELVRKAWEKLAVSQTIQVRGKA